MCLWFKHTPEVYQGSAAKADHSAYFVVVTDNTSWFDDFNDASSLATLAAVQISDGQLMLANDALRIAKK